MAVLASVALVAVGLIVWATAHPKPPAARAPTSALELFASPPEFRAQLNAIGRAAEKGPVDVDLKAHGQVLTNVEVTRVSQASSGYVLYLPQMPASEALQHLSLLQAAVVDPEAAAKWASRLALLKSGDDDPCRSGLRVLGSVGSPCEVEFTVNCFEWAKPKWYLQLHADLPRNAQPGR
jgi:hypothetical protein